MKVPALGRNGTDSQHSVFIDVDEVTMEQPIAVTRQSFDDWMVPVYAPLILFWCAEKAHRSGISGGKSYIDFAGGIADNALGHAHPRVQAALVG